ncbi:MAG: SDR family NAD(P)-dependent oxidoreductase [Thermodesulfobacteriota bacterium]
MTAVVTGGTRGIGLGLATALIERGASVALTYLANETAAQEAQALLSGRLKPGRRVLLLRGDAGDPAVVSEQCRRVREELGPIAVLVNNAGRMNRKTFEEITDEEWRETIRVNLDSAFYWSSRVVLGMKAARYGRIINISSLAARGGGVVGPHYAASKAGLVGLTRYAARELGPFGITVNAIAPAFIEEAGLFSQWPEEKLAELKDKVCTTRIGRVSDVVRAFEYLLDSPFVTGVTLDVCGGAFMI